jgi:hypothetical protein
VWDTVGAQTDNRAKLGTPPERPSIGEWHLDKDGVPVAGPRPDHGKQRYLLISLSDLQNPEKLIVRPTNRTSTGGQQEQPNFSRLSYQSPSCRDHCEYGIQVRRRSIGWQDFL